MENLENIIVYGFGASFSLFVILYFWLLLRRIRKFSKHHDIIKTRRSMGPAYLILMLSSILFVYSVVRILLALN